jgi:ATP-binding cassette, subfamily B, bacterial
MLHGQARNLRKSHFSGGSPQGLCGHRHHPMSRRIFADGIDVASMATEAWRERLTGVFQDFLRFELRACHTGSVSDVLRLDDQLVVVAAVGRVGAADLVAPWRRGCRRLLRSGVGVAF